MALALTVFAGAAAAATLEALSIERLSQESTAIARGRFTPARTERQGPLEYTVYRLAVDRAFKADPPALIEVYLPGGENQHFSGVPNPQPDRDYLVFLWTGPSGRTQITGLAQGLFELQTDASGVLHARRALNLESIILPGADPAEAPAADWPLDRLLERVQAALTPGVVLAP